MDQYRKLRLTAGVVTGALLGMGTATAHDGTNDAGTPVCLEANYMVANAMFTPFASADGPGEVVEQNIITGERGITVSNPFTAINTGGPVCPPEMECPGPWKPTGTFSGGMTGHAFITSAGQQALTEFHRDGTPIRTVSYRPVTGNPLGPAGRGSVPRPLGTQIMPNGNLVQSICDANFFNAQNSDLKEPDEVDPPVLTTNPAIPNLAANQFFPPVFTTPERSSNSRILVIDQETLQVIDEYSQPKRGKLGHDLWGCAAGIMFDSDYMYISTFHGGAVLAIDWRAGIDNHSRGVGSNKKRNDDDHEDDGKQLFKVGKKKHRAKVAKVIDFVGGAADNPHRRDTLRAISFDESGNIYATNRRRSQACLRGEIGPGGCNPSVFRQRISIDIIGEDNGVTDEDATLALDPGVNIIAGIRVNRMSARGCDFVQADGVGRGIPLGSRESNELCNVETLYVGASAMNPGCVNPGPVAANPCFTPGGYVAEYRIDEDHLDGAALAGDGSGLCSGDPNDPAGNVGCAQPIATYGGEVNGDVNIDPRMLMPIQRSFIQ
ncbi:MAG: hypothetical protein KZQ91_14270 [Candidatus Thiodiazotropha sp. (ex Lucinoma borealis)]|nr:hypothetical protein [Candidatus Thiodiazotropha sp. (ex Lucinoma borealis)]